MNYQENYGVARLDLNQPESVPSLFARHLIDAIGTNQALPI